jgi:hypothetical protein
LRRPQPLPGSRSSSARPGSATTDFGALDVAPALDGKPVTAAQLEKLTALTQAAWHLFEQVAMAAPPCLVRGPPDGLARA